MKKIVLFLFLYVYIFAIVKEFKFDTKSIQTVMSASIGALDSKDIDNAIPYNQAVLIQDKIDTKFSQEQTIFKKQVSKYKNIILKNKNIYQKLLITTQELAKQLRLKRQEIAQTKEKIKSTQEIIKVFQKIKEQSIDTGIKINDSISYDGYFIMVIEGKRSVSKKMLSSAVFKQNSQFILKNLAKSTLEHIYKIDKSNILISSIGDINIDNPKKIIVNNLGYVVDKYFTNNSKAVLIYATKISLFPFKNGVLDKIKSNEYQIKYISYIQNNNDLYTALVDIEKLYPKLPDKYIQDWRHYIAKTLVSIKEKNHASDIDIENLIDSYYSEIKNIEDNIQLNQKELKELLEYQKQLVQRTTTLNSLYLQKELLRNEAKKKIRKTLKELNDYKSKASFTLSMMLDRKYTDATITIKDIAQDLMMNLRDRFINIEVSLNNEKLDILNSKNYNYDARYISAKIIPYYKDDDANAIIGAVVVLQAKFIPQEIIKKYQSDYLYSPIEKEYEDYIIPAMVKVPAGSFVMGSEMFKDTLPLHTVKIQKDFYISKYEVTFNMYDKFCIDTKRKFPSDEGWGRGNRPVINVSYNDAKEYIKWLNKKTGMNYALPTEAQWEYASTYVDVNVSKQNYGLDKPMFVCRYANLADANTNYPWKVDCNDGYKTTAIVGEYRPNPLGLYDMSGNVWEWVEDNYSKDYSKTPVDGSANLKKYDGTKVLRGGSWYNSLKEVSTAYRDNASPSFKGNRFGFRLVGNAVQKKKLNLPKKYKYLR